MRHKKKKKIIRFYLMRFISLPLRTERRRDVTRENIYNRVKHTLTTLPKKKTFSKLLVNCVDKK